MSLQQCALICVVTSQFACVLWAGLNVKFEIIMQKINSIYSKLQNLANGCYYQRISQFLVNGIKAYCLQPELKSLVQLFKAHSHIFPTPSLSYFGPLSEPQDCLLGHVIIRSRLLQTV